LANSLLNPTAGYRLTVDLEHAAPWTGSEFRYNRAVVEGTWYSRMTGTSVLATRLRGGWIGWGRFDVGSGPTDIVHPQKRFYAGGANSVRGFGQSRLGPRVLAVDDPGTLLTDYRQVPGALCLPAEIIDLTCSAQDLRGIFVSRPIGGTRVIEGNLELRFALGREFEFVTFGDFGQVWGADQTFSPGDLEFTPGGGVRYLSPVGPIRVDVGYSFRGSERLAVVTKQITPYSGDCAPEPSPCVMVRDLQGVEMPFPYVLTGELALLPDVLFGGNESRFQLHLSIGQAF
jgi:outer membrane protein assembly factor BamA